MQEEEKQNHSAGTPPEQPKKHKKEKGKSLLETMREIDAKEAEKEAEAEERRQALLAEREKKEKEDFTDVAGFLAVIGALDKTDEK